MSERPLWTASGQGLSGEQIPPISCSEAGSSNESSIKDNSDYKGSGDIHQYGTRGRDNLRVQQQRTVTFEHTSSRVDVKLIKRLPDGVKQGNSFKLCIACHLSVNNALYSVEFTESRWAT
ncbi:hypothetical protein J6590_085856 [Homalodisca vitripennis]|nr:hypothetical protein J6590_085856 [Homalodisca vitripennis]